MCGDKFCGPTKFSQFCVPLSKTPVKAESKSEVPASESDFEDESESKSDSDSTNERNTINPNGEKQSIKILRPSLLEATTSALKARKIAHTNVASSAQNNLANPLPTCSDPHCSDPSCEMSESNVCTDPDCTECDSSQNNYARFVIFGAVGVVISMIIGYALYLRFKNKPKTSKNMLPIYENKSAFFEARSKN